MAPGPAYELFLDESGTFEDGATVGTRGQRFASQLAGVLAPAGELTKGSASALLEATYMGASQVVPEEVHGKDLWPGPAFDRLITSLLDELQRRRWRTVRLVNEEAVRFGDRSTSYTAMVAELVFRVVEQLTAEGTAPATLKVTGAYVKLGEDAADRPVLLEQEEYERRLREQTAFAGIRRGAPRLSNRVAFEMRLGSGTKWPELQICDLVSNASHSDFKKCGPALKARFQLAFGALDQTLTLRTSHHRVDAHLADGSLGLALRDIREAHDELVSKGPEGQLLRARLAKTISALASLPAALRATQLQVLTAWAEQLNEQTRELALAAEVVAWLGREVEAPLRTKLGDAGRELDGFTFALQRLALTTENHLGRLEGARRAADAIDQLVPRMVGQWEHAHLIMQAFIAQAVHYTDCWEHERAAQRMTVVARYYGDLGAMMSDAMPDVFPARVRSEIRGQALGTQLQATTYAALMNASRLPAARALSDQAIDEFEALADKQRQYLYRAHLEVVAGELTSAREFLARALACAQPTHALIAAAIKAMPVQASAFAVLHWFRLGAASSVAGDPAETDAFHAALDESGLNSPPWTDGETYPTHGIRRYLAVILAARGRTAEALGVLNKLAALTASAGSGSVFWFVQAAAQLEVAALLLDSDQAKATRLLDDKKLPGAKQIVQRIEAQELVKHAVAGWSEAIDQAVKSRSPAALRALARRVPY